MKKTLFLALLGSMILCGCNKKTILNDTHGFANNTWMRFEPEVFKYNIPNDEDFYNIDFTIELDTTQVSLGRSLPMVVDFYTEEGEHRMANFSFQLKDDHTGYYLGTHQGPNVVISNPFREFMSYNQAGAHRLEIKQGTSKYEIHGIVSLNVQITKAKLTFPNQN